MDRRTVLAFFLIALILILLPKYYELIPPLSTKKNPDEIIPHQKSVERIINNTELTMVDSPQVKTEREPQYESYEEEHITIKTNLYEASISSIGGGSIVSYKLNNYLFYDSSYVNLIYKNNLSNLIINFMSIDGDKISLNNSWETISKSLYIDATIRPQSISFQTIYNAEPIYKTLTFYPNSYKISIDADLTAIQNYISHGIYALMWKGGLPVTEKNVKDDLYYFKGYFYQGGDLHTQKIKSSTLKMERFIGNTIWVAIRSKYFVSALIPDVPAPSIEIGGYQTELKYKNKKSVYNTNIYQNISSSSSITLYLGPLEYNRIKNLGVNLHSIMNFGLSFIRPISRGVLYLLKSMHNFIPNYGVLLIIFSILVKIIVYPLTKKSYQSTREMQTVQPLIANLRSKYKNDPQRLNKETMKLYKEHGVNPLGGCIPMLIQMPLLFSLFIVFRTTIELRGAPFMLWIKDLSAPDTIFYLPTSIPIYGDQVAVLPILMAISIFLQQKMSGVQAQAQQKYMMYFMTVFFFLLFNSFPSGLNLYYTLFNILTIVQQKYFIPKPASQLTSKQ